VSVAASARGSDGGSIAQRLLAFELCGTLFALPITEVAEVADLDVLASVPMVDRRVGGVVNHHGDAVPVVFGDALLGTERTLYPQDRPLLILARDPDDPNRYGVPVDRIWGLVEGPPPAPTRGAGPVAERRPLDGRMLCVLDPASLLERAREVIAGSVAALSADSTHGGSS